MRRYQSLGLLANPFAGSLDPDEPAVTCEIQAAGNRLLGAIWSAAQEDAPKPIRVDKNPDIPPSYALAAVSHAERSLAADDSLNVLYAYVQLFMFRMGVTRATLGVIAERLSFRDFESVLVPYVAKVLQEPDESLASYSVVGPDGLADFADKFGEDPVTAVRSIFGDEEIERHQELIGAIDPRRGGLEDEGEEDDDAIEVDETIGDAPGTAVLLAQSAAAPDDGAPVLDYLIDYTRAHLSPVVARGLRLYRERGLAALAEELKITKAPRKTLGKLIDLAMLRYGKVALLFDEFEHWSEIPVDLRSQVVASMTSMRWKLAGVAVMVLMLAAGEAPELEETFAGGPVIGWGFDNLAQIQDSPDGIDSVVINDWLASAALPGTEPITADDPGVRRLMDASGGSLSSLLDLGRAAIEHAAERHALCIDDDAVAAAIAGAQG
jgi:hypothetical protein